MVCYHAQQKTLAGQARKLLTWRPLRVSSGRQYQRPAKVKPQPLLSLPRLHLWLPLLLPPRLRLTLVLPSV